MVSSEEKIRAFFSDDEKMKMLGRDEEFMEKISSRKATIEDYEEEFKKFGVNFSYGEIKSMQNIVDEIFKMPVEKLNEDFLKEVAGGSPFDKTINNSSYKAGHALTAIGATSMAMGGAYMLASLGCLYLDKKLKTGFIPLHFETPAAVLASIGASLLAGGGTMLGIGAYKKNQ